MPSKATATVLYPHHEGCKFDYDYYTSTHLPLCDKTWKPHGLLFWNAAELKADTGYVATVTFTFKDEASMGAGLGNAAEVMADVPKYTDTKPVILTGSVIAEA